MKLAYSIPEAYEIIGISRSKLYEFLGNGQLVAKKAHGRTLILADELKRFVDDLPVQQFKQEP